MAWVRGVPPPERAVRQTGLLVTQAELVHYTGMGGWHWCSAHMNIPDEGWKLHVSGKGANAYSIYRRVLPILRQHQLAHKFLPRADEVDLQTGTQAGKILCVYPADLQEAFDAVRWIDAALAGVPRVSSPNILTDIAVGATVVYARYGGFSNDYVLNPQTGQLEAFLPTNGAFPAWIVSPWGNYPNPPAGAVPWPVHPVAGRRLGPVRRV